ncbi:hypothetical protein SISNIDRAFT_487182 [Sistotremastrum niveocremeum HHB9708]|uniref:Uncharacterized protein n=2 Tax=Sistotremastraceae TaxID=3402574 RepID=A0A164SWK9_9AGAM|nr:hypothetical protein SISNIDRAFT_487182 [Sistotremastrum niveocremeum HHB9708]KZT40305.1 hypothetical protein SISSUDRAFT_1060378 [Sistotremastrum suecicum HHB10207 ss-3]
MSVMIHLTVSVIFAYFSNTVVGSLVCSWLASEAEESSFVTLTEKKSAFALSIQELKDRATKLRTKPKNLLQSLAKLDEELKNWRVELASPIKSNPTLRKMQITSVLTAIAVKPEGFESAMRDTLKQGLKGNVKSLSFEGIADVWFEVARTLLQHPGAL